MALDNPSYFSIIAESNNGLKRTGESTSSSSQSSLSRQLTPPRGGYNSKSSMRTFLRSASSNSADSNQELFIMGEPRLSDIAPELAFSQQRRANSKPAESSCHDLMYFPLPTSEDAIVSEHSDEEVFISDGSVRYYNITGNPNPDNKRHSISSFTARERTASIASSSRSFKEDMPEAIVHATLEGECAGASASITIDDHSIRHGAYPRKRCNRCTKKIFVNRSDMDDILIISLKKSAAAALWVDYFNTYFKHMCEQANRKHFKIQHLGAEDVIEADPSDVAVMEERTSGVKLQLIVVCPSLLDHISMNPTTSSRLGKLIIPDRTLALLLGVADENLNDIHKNSLSTYFQWQRLSVGQDQDENFTKEFLGTAVSILSRVWKQQSFASPQQKPHFSVLPKKVRQGHSSVVIILTHPLKREDIIKVSVERNNKIFEIKTVKRRNPYTLKITIPDSCTEVSAIVHILVEKNGSIIGSSPIKCESRLRELEQILRSNENPMDFMCQALGFSPSNKEHMDNCLVYSFQKNLPPNFNLLVNHTPNLGSNMYVHRHGFEEYPTLLHFAARYGLEKLAMQLLDCPGGDLACDIKNSCDLTPSEIAQNAGHTDLAYILSGYMKMNEFKTVYEKLKQMSLESKHLNEDEDEAGYLTPNAYDSNAYKLCPPPKPFKLSTPLPLSIEEETMPCGYLTMSNLAQVKTNMDHLQSPTKTTPDLKLDLLSIRDTSDREALTASLQQNIEMYEDKVQTELLEIINDFKNNVHSISQVEKLVEEWKSRNDVQLSFKEKQDQLNEMRVRYDKIQQEMKTNLKKATPFERVKKLLFKGKSKNSKSGISLPDTDSTIACTPLQGKRPISSLSLHSTSSSESSGRTSTISGCSVGDSGTHSDHEDRKNIMATTPDEEFRNELNKAIINLNYMVPPPPKPFNPVVKLAKSTPFPTIEEGPSRKLPETNGCTSDAYYIQFPPSGLPIRGMEYTKSSTGSKATNLNNQTKQGTECNQNYMNLQGNLLHTKESQDFKDEEFQEYMNYKPVKEF